MPSQRLKGLANGKLGCPEEAIDVWPWLQDRFDRGKRRRRSSTPAVVPGAAPALAKAGVGGYHLVGGLEHQCYFPRNIGLLIIPLDEVIFFRGGGPTTNQSC